MIPLIALVIGFVIFTILGHVWLPYLANYHHALRPALAVMFLLTASAHWGAKRIDLIRMVPPSFPQPGMWVTLTGILEILGAIGLLIPLTAPWAAICLAVLLLALFPANVYAAHHRLTIGGTEVPALLPRTLIQILFVTCAVFAAFG